MSTSGSDLSLSDPDDNQILSSDEEEECSPDVPQKTAVAIRFSEAQKACLTAYYTKGMNGTGRRMNSLICKAAKDTRLSISQVKV